MSDTSGVPEFRPDPEMFVCMDPTGCYYVSWSPEQHHARMVQVGAVHEARYVRDTALVEAERRGKREGIEAAAGYLDDLADQHHASAISELGVAAKIHHDAAEAGFRHHAAAIRQLGAPDAQDEGGNHG